MHEPTAQDIHHEAHGVKDEKRRAEIGQMDNTRRCYSLARSEKFPSHRKASDDTIYRQVAGGQLIRVTKKETKAERKARKKARKNALKNR